MNFRQKHKNKVLITVTHQQQRLTYQSLISQGSLLVQAREIKLVKIHGDLSHVVLAL